MPKITYQQAIALTKGLYIDPLTPSNSSRFSNPPSMTSLFSASCDLPNLPVLGDLTSATYTLVTTGDDLGSIYGNNKGGQFLRDVKNGVDSLDIFVIGDSNANFNGWGWADSLNYSLATDFSMQNYATPIYSAFTKGQSGPEYYGIHSKAGYYSYAAFDEITTQTWTNNNELGSPSNLGGKFFRGSQNTYPTLTSTLTSGSGVLQPNSNKFDFGVIADDPAQGSGTQFCTPFNGVYLNDGSTTPWIKKKIKYRLVHAKGNGFGVIKPVFILNAVPYTPYAAFTINCNDTSAANPYWTTTEMEVPADENRGTSSYVFAFSYSSFNLTYEGVTYTNGYTTLPAAIALHSISTPIKGYAVTCLDHHGGANISSIDTDITQGTTVVSAYLKEAYQRQVSCGGSGRVLIFITAGMNADTAVNFKAKTQNIISSISSAWGSLGYSGNKLAFVVVPSHQANSSDSYPGPSGSTLAEVRQISLDLITNTRVSVSILPNLLTYTTAQSSGYLTDSNSAGGATGFVHLTEIGSKFFSQLIINDLLRYKTDLDIKTGGSIRTNSLTSVLSVNTAERNYHLTGASILKKIKK
jgi:hypothetical protein